MKLYVRTLKAHLWLLVAVENAYSELTKNSSYDVTRLAKTLRASDGRPISDDEYLVALNALGDLGIIERKGPRSILNRDRLIATEQFRLNVQAAVEVLNDEQAVDVSNVQLCVSLPPTISPAAGRLIYETSTDLRSGLLDVIASAQHSLIVASPFWDAGATADIAGLVNKKLASGTEVSLLGRFSNDLPSDVRSQLKTISQHSACTVLSWFDAVGDETQTFHFKALSADHGRRAYLGSANMTVSSLRSRMELGVIATGLLAEHLDRILRIVLTVATRLQID